MSSGSIFIDILLIAGLNWMCFEYGRKLFVMTRKEYRQRTSRNHKASSSAVLCLMMYTLYGVQSGIVEACRLGQRTISQFSMILLHFTIRRGLKRQKSVTDRACDKSSIIKLKDNIRILDFFTICDFYRDSVKKNLLESHFVLNCFGCAVYPPQFFDFTRSMFCGPRFKHGAHVSTT